MFHNQKRHYFQKMMLMKENVRSQAMKFFFSIFILENFEKNVEIDFFYECG
jgi:hypothetical protein